MSSPKASSYDADAIIALEGLEAVYMRPAMYVGTTDKRGFHHLLWEIVDNSVDEAMGGYADHISVTIHEDESVTVTDNGRGIPVAKQTAGAYKGMSTLEMVMTVLHAGGKFEGKGYTYSGGLHGVGVSVVNALSTRLDVEVRRDGKVYAMSFAGQRRKVRGSKESYVPGLVSKPLHVVGPTKRKGDTGTSIRFWPNSDVFSCDSWDSKLVLTNLQRRAYLNPGLTFRFEDLRHDDPPVEFCYPNGLADFMAEEGAQRLADSDDAADEPGSTGSRMPLEPILLGGESEDTEGEWTLALQWFPDERYVVHSFANGVTTPNGGTHVKGVEEAMLTTLNNFARQDHIGLLSDKDPKIATRDWTTGCGLVIAVKVRNPQFVGQTKDELSNPETKAMVRKQFAVQFAQWLESHPAEAKAIVERIVTQMRFRTKMAELARAEKAKGKQGIQPSKLPLPTKLIDCTRHDGAELFIVEGDSAAGPAIKARDNRFQAVLPVRGKGLNIERALNGRDESKISDNKEVQGIIATIGAGSQSMFDISKMRYDKVILLMDADADGAHIRLLLTTLFYRLMTPLVEQGHLYVARPPLFTTRLGDKKVYFRTERERDAFLAEHPRHSEAIIRNKGLGEMNADELGETSITPATRTLARIVVEDAEAADETLRTLMGSNAALKWDVLRDVVFDEEDVA